MASNHISFNDQIRHGSLLRKMLQAMELADDAIAVVRDVMIQMRDGDGSQAAHYAVVTAKFGFDSDEKAKAAFDELDSAYIATQNAAAARNQLQAKLR